MNKKLAAALSGSAAIALTLTGCSDDSGAKADEWAKQVCDQVQPQVKKIQEANTSINDASKEKNSSEDVKKTDAAAFEKISGAYKSLGDAVDEAGPPPVDNGEQLHSDAVKELRGISAKYGQLRKTVDGLDTKDQAKFAEGLQGIATQLDTLGKSGDKALSKLQSGDVGKAMANQKGCKRPGNPPSV
ncbi:small secreted protein [Streptomyces abyssalis]|uniref:Small secreted protein n=1 Tax=Streptomyces abyssalis TaxID=933944 RepID=A0A1E7JQH3_9ACTN|nr:small secreted protein [Streptomyces abyssalis]OEU90518.1 small secreted protein [Streptomyces abyssalis]OEU95257.1 small secreted protein [Streptomyces abyssalis]OEV29590.1 small secreted protein [Streptomyces nanshensis]